MRYLSSGDEDNMDMRSDTAYDSLRTDATRSSMSFHPSKLDTIFLQEPSTPSPDEEDHPNRKSSSPEGSHSRTPRRRKDLALDDHLNTPGRTPRRDHLSTPSLTAKNLSETSETMEKFPSPSWATQLYIKEPEWDHQSDPEDLVWGNENEGRASGLRKSFPWNLDEPHDLTRRAEIDESDTTIKQLFGGEPVRGSGMQADFEVRTSVFDWSEQQPIEKSLTDTPPRPKTVHGKKDTDGRGSRPTGRRGPSGQHARSQSVPITADPAAKRANGTNKFGTWGIGSKPVTEDWDEDFDFADLEPAEGTSATCKSDAADSGVDVFVPEAIREQQSNILANIELLREWGVLIEELKEMRGRTTALGISTDTSGGVFAEVDAMINLADQEAEEQGVSQRWSIASTSDFNADDFDTFLTSPIKPATDEALGEDSFGTVPSNLLDRSSIALATKHSSATLCRPRKNSEAVARSVIQALRERTLPSDEADTHDTTGANKKVPFDTATLKHIVPYVNGLMRQMKQILRDAENLHVSPPRSIAMTNSLRKQAPAQAMEGSPRARRTLNSARKSESLGSRDNSNPSTAQAVDELASSLRLMAV